jgi:hypothetical protein
MISMTRRETTRGWISASSSHSTKRSCPWEILPATNILDEKIARVEFTSTFRDADLALRMEYMARYGAVVMSGRVWRDGTKAAGGQIYVVPECQDYESRVEELVAIIEKRVAKKLTLPYASGTILTIVYDDLYHRSETHAPQLQAYLRDKLSKQVLDKFCGVFIIGTSGKTFLEFGDTDAAHVTR